MESIARDVRQAARALSRSPGVTGLIVLTLALGIGANSAIFSLVNAVLLRPLPYAEPDRLVRIGSARGGEDGQVSLAEVPHLRRLRAFADVAAYAPGAQYNLSEGGAPEEVPATLCTGNLFEVLGIPLHLGDTWPASYDQDRDFGIVLNHGFWQRRFAGNPGVLGRRITLDAAPNYTVFGVLPAGFDFPVRSDLFRSIVISADQLTDLNNRGVWALARLAPAVSLEQAQTELDAVSRYLADSYPESNRGLRFVAVPLGEVYVGQARPYLVLLLAAVVLILLIACANVVNLLLTRAVARERESTLRAALGASRGGLIRQHLLESLLLALAGGAAGLLLAFWWTRALAAGIGVQLPHWMSISLDGTVLAFTFLVAAATGLLAGALPALHVSRPSLAGLLIEGSRGAAGGKRRQALRRALVAAEIGLALALLIGAGLLVKSFSRLQQVDPGFDGRGALTFRIALPWSTYDRPRAMAFYRELLDRLAALPGVTAVATNSNLPMSGETDDYRSTVTLGGQTPEEQQKNTYVHAQRVSPGYFSTLRIPLLRGRGFTLDDDLDAPPVAVVSASFARRFWPGRDAIGQRLLPPGPDRPWFEVVGLVGDVQHEQLGGGAGLSVYYPFSQLSSPNAYVVLRTGASPQALAEPATRAVWSIDPEQSTFDFRTLEERIASGTWQKRISGVLFSMFAALALVLAAVGIYGVTSYGVSQRTREIGIRMALGARARDVLRDVLGETAAVALAGVAAGLAAAFALARGMAGLLFEVSATDPAVFLAVPLLLAAVALAASLLPARRAARVDPVITLRQD